MKKYKQRHFINNQETESSSSYLLYPLIENICVDKKKNTDVPVTAPDSLVVDANEDGRGPQHENII